MRAQIQTTVYLDDATRRRLRLISAATGVPMAEIIRRGVDDQLTALGTDPRVAPILAAA